ncbi:MAG: formylmethanofuran dehydrogenase subunit E family protein [Candidatus Bathyarchaeota archaeon]|nr:formylmethanofuran dehydrogenase subunit E family protein [Candidatus Bathyarchaeota archaeon]
MLDEKLKLAVKEAEKFHGHLGPFLVLGVRMGETAKKILKTANLQVVAKLPLSTPFSCVLDGIQVATQCTIGNQKLKIENSSKEISADFQCVKTHKKLTIAINSKITEALTKKFSEGASNEELAWEIARTSEDQLFIVKKQ